MRVDTGSDKHVGTEQATADRVHLVAIENAPFIDGRHICEIYETELSFTLCDLEMSSDS